MAGNDQGRSEIQISVLSFALAIENLQRVVHLRLQVIVFEMIYIAIMSFVYSRSDV